MKHRAVYTYRTVVPYFSR